MASSEARRHLTELVRDELRAFVGLRPADALPLSTAFLDLGFDSLRAVDFKTVLEERLGRKLRSTVLYDCPTVDALVDFLWADEPAPAVDAPRAPELDVETAPREALVAALRAARAELDRQHAPIAIVGMACRFPGAPDLDTFWRLQLERGDAIRPVPRDRWSTEAWYDPTPGTLGKMAVREGGFVEGLELLDAAFFNLSPREARALDPQQRLLLEVAWEALEHAAIAPDDLVGRAGGVFIGLRESEYFVTQGRHDPRFAELYVGTGNALSTAAGRISFTLGLTGPALSVDTACSSSLVAVHLAMGSLRRGEADLALAGGVNVLLDPLGMVGLSRGGMLSPDARCKTFAAGANGYVRSEGAGMVVLKRLDDAQRDGDRVWGVLLGAAINQDGKSGGLTVPYGPAQEAVIRAALADGRVSPREVSYVEAHGTGTALGDPIEITAIDRVFRGRRAPLPVGTIKTNIGHLETAAGVAGLIRTVLALDARVIPAIRSLEQPSPHIPWAEICAVVPTREAPWTTDAARRVAGVSSFGFSGTNAHVVVAEAPEPAAPAAPPPAGDDVLFLSAASEAALAAQVTRHAQRLAALDDARFADACFTSRAGRAQLEHRLAVTASSRADLVRRLERIAEGAEMPGVYAGRAPADPPRVAFLFTGQGAQYAGMGRDLAEASPVFAAALSRAGAALAPHLPVPLTELLWGGATDRLAETDGAQPALFAVEYALVELWRSVGVTPAVVLGHSVGELAAAVCAGLWSLEDAARVVAARGRLMTERTEPGAMITVFAEEATVAPKVARLGDRAAISGYNGPANLTVSGAPAVIEALAAELAAEGVSTRKVIASRAFHSPLMRPMLASLDAELDRAARGPLTVEVVSTAAPSEPQAWLDPRYFSRQILEPVRFTQALAEVARRGVTTFLEIGPRPTLCTLGKELVPGAFVPSMRPGRDGKSQLVDALAQLWARGVRVRGRAVFAEGRRPVPLPSYPFQRKRYWYESAAVSSGGAVHPLLGAPVSSPALDPRRLEHASQLAPSSPTWLADHAVAGRALFPAAGYVELALAALERAPLGAGSAVVSELRITAPLAPEPSATPLSTALIPAEHEGGAARVEIAAWSAEEARWIAHATAQVSRAPYAARRVDVAALSLRIGTAVEVAGFYAGLAALGLEYGPAFRGVERLWAEGDEALARVRLPESAGTGEDYHLHPALLDACFQVSAAALEREGGEGRALPVAIARVVLHAPLPSEVVCHVARRAGEAGSRAWLFDLTLASSEGDVVAEVAGLELLRVGDGAIDGEQLLRRMAYALEWRRAPEVTAGATAARAWVLPDDEGLSARLAAQLAARGVEVHVGAEPPARAPAQVVVIARGPRWLSPLLAAARAEVSARVYVVTSSDAPAAAGFVAAWAAESPALRLTRVELSPAATDAELSAVVAELTADTAETAVRVIDGERRVARLVRGVGQAFASLAPPPPGQPWMLRTRGYGQLQNLHFVPGERRAPGPGEVEVELAASALNFRDVLHAMGLLEAFSRAYGVTRAEEQPFGFDGVGVVVRAGEGAAVPVGARVLVLGFGTCASHLTVDARQVAPAPANLSDADGAAAITAYLTALIGLERLAQLRAGETVLIHGAAGGVGQAAIAVALRAGARVFATAHPKKHAAVRAAGVREVYGSRDLAFADAIRAATGGRGVDVVLSSVGGEALDASLALVAEGGRFVEIGKLDSLSSDEVARRYPRVRYLPFDLGEVSRGQPDLVPQLLGQLSRALDAGALPRLPAAVFAADDAVSAFSLLARSGHLGKVVLRHPGAPLVRADRAVLITGGLGALGLVVAEALVGAGARRLALLGRSAPGPEAEALIARCREAAVEVAVLSADVGSLADLSRALAAAPPLGAVVHAAGVLDDAPVPALDEARVARVMAPKVEGARHLSQLLAGRSLDFFAAVTSASGVLGSAGQAAYAAANAGLAGEMAARRARGEPGVALAFGAWGERGMAARLAEPLKRRMREGGLRELSPAEGAALVLAMLSRGAGSSASPAEVLLLPVHWPRLLARPGMAEAPLFEAFRGAAQAAAGPARGVRPEVLRARLAAAEPGARPTIIAELLASELASVIGMASGDEIDRDRKLTSMGVDSLLAVDLRNRLEASLGRKLSASLLFDHPTIADLSLHLSRELDRDLGRAETAAAPAPEVAAPAPAAEGEALPSEAELARRLEEQLARMGGA